MIKIFGKVRYHWQPELSVSIIYWSFVITPLFIYLILLYERAKVPVFYFGVLLLCLILVLMGLRRYFIIQSDGYLSLVSTNPWRTYKLEIASIHKIEVTYSSITIIADKFPEGRTFYMRKWPKKYFINALVLEPSFQGEIELVDHLIKMDYFEVYYSDSNKR